MAGRRAANVQFGRGWKADWVSVVAQCTCAAMAGGRETGSESSSAGEVFRVFVQEKCMTRRVQKSRLRQCQNPLNNSYSYIGLFSLLLTFGLFLS